MSLNKERLVLSVHRYCLVFYILPTTDFCCYVWQFESYPLKFGLPFLTSFAHNDLEPQSCHLSVMPPVLKSAAIVLFW